MNGSTLSREGQGMPGAAPTLRQTLFEPSLALFCQNGLWSQTAKVPMRQYLWWKDAVGDNKTWALTEKTKPARIATKKACTSDAADLFRIHSA